METTYLPSETSSSEKHETCVKCGSNALDSAVRDDCEHLVITNYIRNRQVPTKARLSLPDELVIDTLTDGSYQVRSKRLIPMGTCFGPLEANKSFTLNPIIQLPLKIFPYEEDDFLDYYLDTSSEQDCSWMMFVMPAVNCDEQNLVCFQDKHEIYYVSIKNIYENESLKVWYAPYYANKMDKKLLLKEQADPIVQSIPDVNKLVKLQQKILDRDNWTCKFCGVIVTDVTKFADHILQHYSSQLRRCCEICKSTFLSRKSLHKHMKIVHSHLDEAKITTIVSPVTNKVNQNYSKELSIGGPLLTNMELIDNFDNSNLLLPSLDHLDTELENMGTENLNMDNLLSENVRTLDHFNFEIKECQEEFVCDICFKSFSKLRYLVQHLKKHTGENLCSICNKVFGRKENLLHHSCVSAQNYSCKQCNRTFLLEKYLRRHVEGVHNKRHKCDMCNSTYCNKHELKIHNCRANPNQGRKYFCSLCKKTFSHRISLKKHMLRYHSANKSKNFVCEICAKDYFDKYSYEMHMKTHGEPEFQCQVCLKKFHRKNIYQNHLELHSNKKIECDICHKTFSTSRTLMAHKNIHKELSFKCTDCGATYKSKSSLLRHYKSHQKTKKTVDTEFQFTCSYCDKKMKLKSSLIRHVNRIHPEHKKNFEIKKSSQKESDFLFHTETKNNSFLNNELDLMTNSKDNIDLINDSDMNELENKLQIQIIDNILLNTTKEMGIDISDDILDLNNLGMRSYIIQDNTEIAASSNFENREVCLSMPDLMDADQDVNQSENSYVLDSGTLLDSQTNTNNLVVYVLNESQNDIK